MPFFSLHLPDSYWQQHPERYKNLKKNAQQLTTCFDAHATVKDLTCIQEENEKNHEIRAMSLLNEIPENRTCDDIGIAMHYCVCQQDWTEMSPYDEMAVRVAHYLIDFINKNLLAPILTYCYTLKLEKVLDVQFARKPNKDYFKIKVLTSPNDGYYETIIKKYRNETFEVKSSLYISRINPYGDQPNCLSSVSVKKKVHVDLRKFCMCRTKEEIDTLLHSKF